MAESDGQIRSSTKLVHEADPSCIKVFDAFMYCMSERVARLARLLRRRVASHFVLGRCALARPQLPPTSSRRTTSSASRTGAPTTSTSGPRACASKPRCPTRQPQCGDAPSSGNGSAISGTSSRRTARRPSTCTARASPSEQARGRKTRPCQWPRRASSRKDFG